MQKNSPHTFFEKELNTLLNKSFLESHLTKPKYEKITEAIAAHAMGISPAAMSTRQPFTKKFIKKKILRILLLAFLAITGGVSGIALLVNQPEKSKKLNLVAPALPRQTKEVANSNTTKKETSNHTKISSVIASANIYKNDISQEAIYNDSTTNNFIMQQPEPIHFENVIQQSEPIYFEDVIQPSEPVHFEDVIKQSEPIHFEDTEILLRDTKDSISTNSIKNSSVKDKKLKKRKAKILQKEYEIKRKKNKVPI